MASASDDIHQKAQLIDHHDGELLSNHHQVMSYPAIFVTNSPTAAGGFVSDLDEFFDEWETPSPKEKSCATIIS